MIDLLIANLVDQSSNPTDEHMHLTAILQDNRGLVEVANARGCARQNDRSGFECRTLRKVGDLLTEVEDHVSARIATRSMPDG